MMFIASKLLSFAVEPLFWVLIFLLAALLSMPRRPTLGKRLAWVALALLLLSGWAAIPQAMVRDLESRYPPPAADADMQKYVGVVVLGGALARSKIWEAHGQVALNEQAERMTVSVSLAQKHPHLKLLFTGGTPSVPPKGMSEAQRAKIFFDAMGVDPKRVLYESAARNTYENARYSATTPGVDPRQPWLLMTSAVHMPRSMGVFEKTGWNVTPYPVDYRTTSELSVLDYSLHDGPALWELALHEMLGYYVYRMAGML